MDLGLKGKIAVITGGASGIGAASAELLLAEGCKVAVCGRSKEKLDRFAATMQNKGYEVFIKIADVADMISIQDFADEVNALYGGIDIWINNAGIEHYVPLLDCDETHWNEVIDVDLTGVWRGCKAAIPYISENGGGTIINLSSFCSHMPTAKNGVYSIAKAGVNALTKVLAAELAPRNIRVNCIVPGFINTDMTSHQIKTIEEMLIDPISMRRFGKPEEIAYGILYLTSEKFSSYITGHELIIAGGKFLVQNPKDPWNNYEGGY